VWVLLPTDVVVRCVPAGESIASAESASLDAAEKVAVIVADWPTCMLVPRDDEMVAVGSAGGVTVSIAVSVSVPPEPTAVQE